MVLVAKEFRRRGLASRLMRRCIDELVAGGRVPVLDATPDGQQVYRALGFEDTWGFHRLVLRDRASVDPRSRRLPASRSRRSTTRSGRNCAATTRRPLARIAARCWRACADDCRRANLWRCATAASRASCWDAMGGRASQLGPLVAEDDAVAQALLARAIAAIDGPIYVDLADYAHCGSYLAGSARVHCAAAAHPNGLPATSGLRRSRPHLRGGRSGIRMTAHRQPSS